MTPVGFPHSDIRGSREACSSPRLIAACHVLHRLSAPRHPPCALTTLGRFRSTPDRSPLQVPARSVIRSAHLTRRLIALDYIPNTHIFKKPAHPQACLTSTLVERESGSVGLSGRPVSGFQRVAPSTRQLQKGGDPAAGSPTATLLRLRPSHRACLRPLPPCGWDTDFGRSRLPWRDGRCVQGPGTYSPRHG